MFVTLLGMVTAVRPLQPEKALFPMLVTLLGIVTVVRPVQFLNALLPIVVTPFGTTYSVISDPSLLIS